MTSLDIISQVPFPPLIRNITFAADERRVRSLDPVAVRRTNPPSRCMAAQSALAHFAELEVAEDRRTLLVGGRRRTSYQVREGALVEVGMACRGTLTDPHPLG